MATAGATHTIITPQSWVGTKMRCITGQATALATVTKAAKPIHDTATAGRNADRNLAMNSSRSEIEEWSSDSRVRRSFSPAKASAASTADTISGTIRNNGASR